MRGRFRGTHCWGLFMNPLRRIAFILAAILMVTAFANAPAIARQDEGTALNKRLVELYQAGKFSEAQPLAQRALAIWQKALGPDHPNVATSLNNQAEIYSERGAFRGCSHSIMFRPPSLLPPRSFPPLGAVIGGFEAAGRSMLGVGAMGGEDLDDIFCLTPRLGNLALVLCNIRSVRQESGGSANPQIPLNDLASRLNVRAAVAFMSEQNAVRYLPAHRIC